MTHAQEKRRLLASLALLAPVPLPFNEVLEWPVLFVYSLLVLLCWQRIERGKEEWLPDWALNLLGLAYIPILYLEVAHGAQAGFSEVVRALLHLNMFVVVAKLFSLRRDRDKWPLVIAVFFLFLGAMATSSHLSIALYLIAFLLLSARLMATLAHLHVAATFRTDPGEAAEAVSVRWPVLAGSAAAVLLAIPIFALVPRFAQPFVFGSGGGSGGLIRSTGFSDSVDLNLTSAIRGNRNVALRIQYQGGRRRGEEMRFKAATYDQYRGRSWRRLLGYLSTMVPSGGRGFELAPGRKAAEASIYLEPLSSASLVLPLETLAVEMPFVPSLAVDPGGAVLLPGVPDETLAYTVRLANREVFPPGAPPEGEHPLSALDAGGITPRIAELAALVMGEGSEGERVARLERHLLEEYSYTVDFVGRSGEKPIEDFLFNYRSGHCELFATAMVLMLRSQGIPARFVTGFLGGEYNPLEDYYIVRQQNAHAWVEAFTQAEGWKVLDPTPPEGRPADAEQSLKLLVTQMYDYLIFRWDRYVLTFGADDQSSFIQRIRENLVRLRAQILALILKPDPEENSAGAGAAQLLGGEEDRSRPPLLPILTILLLAAALALSIWSRRPPASAESAYLRLRRQLRRAGLEVPDSLAPLRLEAVAERHLPAVAPDTRRVVRLYLRESFAGRPADREERLSLQQHLQAVAFELRQSRGSGFEAGAGTLPRT